MTETSEHLRQSLVDASREAEALRLNAGTSGNISVRTDKGMLITPTGVPSKSLRNEMIVEMEQGKRLFSPDNLSELARAGQPVTAT